MLAFALKVCIMLSGAEVCIDEQSPAIFETKARCNMIAQIRAGMIMEPYRGMPGHWQVICLEPEAMAIVLPSLGFGQQ